MVYNDFRYLTFWQRLRTMSRVSALVQLQTIDHELDEKTKRVKQIDEQLAQDPALLAAQSALALEEKQLSDLRTQLRNREMDASSLETKIHSLEERLYGGRVQNPKELDGLEKDLQMHKRQHSDLDDELLHLMDQVEQRQASVDQKRHEQKSLLSARANRMEQLSTERLVVSDRIKELTSMREQARTDLDGDALRTFDHLRRKLGRAVAAVRREACSACGVAVPTGLIQRVRAGDEIVYCSGCGRILA